jgi:SAM-dependent methyltransferase
MSDDFYRAFEDRHRGSRELIKSRLRVYMPFIEPLLTIYGDAKAIDLGCGRGEWLELLKESGFDAQGVDLDDGMLAACRELGLNVATADALVALKALPDASQTVVSGFHLAEHIQFSDLQTLVQEALRVLKPAGLLILETPNPENIVVGSCNFYLDPTHQRPIPPQLLAFVPDYYGFSRTKIVRLQEAANASNAPLLSLKDVLGGASPDYAVVAQKSADASILTATSQAFEPEYGISFEVLANEYDRRATASAAQAETTAHDAEARAIKAEASAHAAESRAIQAETTAYAAESRAIQAETTAYAAESRAIQAETTAYAAESRAIQAETTARTAESRALEAETTAHVAESRALEADVEVERAGAQSAVLALAQEQRAIEAEQAAQQWHRQANQWHEQILALHGSTSWQVTRPFRGIKRLVTGDFSVLQRVVATAKYETKKILRPVVSSAIAYAYHSPALRGRLQALVMRFPWLYQRMRRVAANTGVLGSGYSLSSPLRSLDGGGSLSMPPELQTMSPRSRQIYIDLKTAIEKKNQGSA